MKVLLDTHTFLWWIMDDPQLSSRAREIMEAGDTEVFLSAASGWEIAIKSRLGRLKLPADLHSFMAEQLRINAIQVLPIQMAHALHVATLPDHHRDPFDRMLVAQSQLERLPILTGDPLIAQYAVPVIW
jgi:PIN domain nuclease of toxin-antitoxin system